MFKEPQLYKCEDIIIFNVQIKEKHVLIFNHFSKKIKKSSNNESKLIFKFYFYDHSTFYIYIYMIIFMFITNHFNVKGYFDNSSILQVAILNI